MTAQPSLFPSTSSTTAAPAAVVSLEDARPLLARLRIKAGLIPSAVVHLGVFSLQIAWSRDHDVFTASLWRTKQPATIQTMAFAPDDVETRGRSLWKTGNTWCLSEPGLEKLLASLVEVEVLSREPFHQPQPAGGEP